MTFNYLTIGCDVPLSVSFFQYWSGTIGVQSASSDQVTDSENKAR